MIRPSKGTNTVRAVLIADPIGTIRTMLYYPQEIGRNFDEILRVLRALQTADKFKVAIPANWPNIELIGGRVIVRPAKTMRDAEDRLADKSSSAMTGGSATRNCDSRPFFSELKNPPSVCRRWQYGS
jgi:hypothetical protein